MSDWMVPEISTAPFREDGFYISRRNPKYIGMLDESEYLRSDLTWHRKMNDSGGSYFSTREEAVELLSQLIKGRRRQPLTITDEGDGKFIATCGDKYTDPDYRWRIIGIVMEWFIDGEHVEHFESAESHAEDAAIIARLFRDRPL